MGEQILSNIFIQTCQHTKCTMHTLALSSHCHVGPEGQWRENGRTPPHGARDTKTRVCLRREQHTYINIHHTHTHKMRVLVICHETDVRPGRASAAVSIPALDRTEAAVAGHTVFSTTRLHCRWGLSHTLVTSKKATATAITLACSTLLLHTLSLSLSLSLSHTHTHTHTHIHTHTHTHTCAHTARNKESMSVRFLHRKCLSAHTYTCTCRHSTTNYAPCRMFVKHKIAIPKNNKHDHLLRSPPRVSSPARPSPAFP